ncbi:hypothetical protein HX021_00925 [Sphingobacterium sp. N143]|uniref:hypothetical protein n=1 Tax=Sphingobacterium sp. N143 TaxID=2746727 RepID=UPI00257871E1|nr:hypothetical protein [Sphingobacterium sp. N143]MDM1292855.1 hypothetical protein [Sphingobacterium sp. N143]
MGNFIVYILTDNNRRHVEIDFTSNIFSTVIALQQSNNFIFHQGPHLNRMVYSEAFSNLENAKRKMDELRGFTRMQLERIIRKHNPNWNNLYPQQHQVYQKRNTSYAA